MILARPGRRRGVATTARRKRRGLSAGTTTLSLMSPVAAVNSECHFDECREILGTTYERHCILDAVGEASVKLVTESLFVVTDQSAVVVEFDEVLVDVVMFAHAESVEFAARFVFLISDAKLDTKFSYEKTVVFTPQRICIIAR